MPGHSRHGFENALIRDSTRPQMLIDHALP